MNLFETAELGRKVSKKEFRKQLPELRAELLQAQFALSRTNTSVIIIISGVNAAGRGDVVNVLNEWLDPRGVETISLVSPTDEEKERPYYWRFWRRLPAGGRVGIFFGAWYVEPIEQLVYQRITPAHFDETLVRIRRFETMLVEDGALLLKFWLHLSKDEQHKRLKKLEKDPHTRRSVSQRDWEQAGMYENFTRVVERAIRHTDSGNAPWLLVEANNQRYRDLTVAQTVLENLRQHCPTDRTKSPIVVSSGIPAEELPALPPPVAELQKLVSPKNSRTILDTVDLTQHLSRKEYDKELETYQGKLHRLAWEANQKKSSTIIVFEGWDAAGKGGCIRRITQAMDARLYQTISTAAPTDEERAHHYLWRFWRHIPRAGMVTIYDRSWYGRVLVERVEGFASEKEWKRAYLEINDFEEQLASNGDILIKFWIHISQEEQLRRFKDREQIAYKRHKITSEDWRNREKWGDYGVAINDMVARTSTDFAPWTLVAGNDKCFGRLQVLKTICNRLETALSQLG